MSTNIILFIRHDVSISICINFSDYSRVPMVIASERLSRDALLSISRDMAINQGLQRRLVFISALYLAVATQYVPGYKQLGS